MTNLLPAILIAGPPHSGKSVLAYLLSRRLREAQVPHILLRAAPDGEGDWFYQGPEEVRLRQRRKGVYTASLLAEMEAAIRRRNLPMLVDIGGRPRDAQFRLFDACTHVIHLWREADDRRQWEAWLEERSLIPIATLQSQLTLPDHITSDVGPLQGIITGLERSNPQPGPLFERVLERVRGICSYPPEALEAEHLRRAPEGIPVRTVAQLAAEAGIRPAERGLWWAPEHLPLVTARLPAGRPLALYGRGPLWLYAAVAARVAPAPFHLFDARFYGWMQPPSVRLNSRRTNLEFTLAIQKAADEIRLRFDLLPHHHVLHPRPIHVPPLPGDGPVVLDGKMPAWMVAALARALRERPRLAVYDATLNQDVVLWPVA
ncbi:MAG: CRISPR-associated protein Csx3 [Anaerolineae bacterium]